METYSFDLSFVDDRDSDLRHPPVAEIFIKTHSQRVSDGPLLITPGCVSIIEFEHEIDRLQAELETIRKKARAKFKAEAVRFQNSN